MKEDSLRRISFLVALALLASTIPIIAPAPTAAATPFTDISNSGFKADIDWAYNSGITGGCSATRFCPKGLVTREQIASFLARMFQLPAATQDYFDDDNRSPHEADINRVAAAGVALGCASGRYCPRAVVEREQMASFIVRAARFSAGAGRDYFWDDNGSGHELDIDRFAAGGVATGCGSYRYCPAGSVTREQMVAFLHRVLVPAAPPPYPAPPPPAPEPSGCHSSYSGYCLTVGIGDWDCLGGGGNGPNYVPVMVRVVGFDEFGLDADDDGYGCDALG
jgi:hypothetical protein